MLRKRLCASLILCVTPMTAMNLTVRSARAAEPPPLVPRQVLFGNPERASVQLSPDGKHLAYLAPVNGVLNVCVAPADKLDAARAVTNDTHRGIRIYFWSYTSQHVLYAQDQGGDENWHVYSVDLKTDKVVDLTPFEKVAARVVEASPDFPEHLLVAVNDRTPQFHDVYRVHVGTGERNLVVQNNEGFAGFLSADDLKVHFAVKVTPDGGSEVHRLVGDNSWTLFQKIGPDDTMTTSPVGLDKSHKNLYMHDSRNRNTAALTIVNLESGEARVLAEDARADVSGAVVHPTGKHVQAVYATFDRRKWKILDPALEPHIAVLKGVADGEFDIVSRTLDDKQWIVAYEMDAGPVRYYRYDTQAKKASYLFSNRPALEPFKLAKMHPAVVKSRDGLDLVCYYTLPTWTDPQATGKPDKPLPTVLFVHGGPWARDDWGYNPYHQWLANRGYAVLSVNYRGSRGMGKEFINAGNLEWAGKMHNDLLDAVDWAVQKGISDKNKVGIMGGSYGGYATLVGLTFTPKQFACGVDIVGPSNLITLLNTIPPYWKPMLDLFTSRVGDHRTEDGRKLLTERSPLSRVDQIERPLLIGQGANDPRVKQTEADQIVEAMKKKNIPVTYVLYPDEGHGFARPENRMSFNAVTEVFLAEHLGGRYENMSEDLTGSSIQVPEGSENVPGLQKLMKGRKPAEPDPS